jgi:hypothetical protein
MHRLVTAGVIVVALAGMGSKCSDSYYVNPDAPKTPKAVRIQDGIVLGKNNFGLFKANNPKPTCRWKVLLDGKVIASGGPKDAIISGHGTQGGVVHATGCRDFWAQL